MARLQVPPTRSNLIAIKHSLKLAQQGHELLNKKRDVLMMEIMRVIADADEVQKQVNAGFERAYTSIEETRVALGTERVRRMALSSDREIDMRVTPRSIMGVVVPSVSFDLPEPRPKYGFGNSSVVLDESQRSWSDVLALMGPLAEKVTTVWRLAVELQRTQRRVNALENVFIPSYEETLRYIEDSLAEKDREELFRAKRAKARLQARTVG